MCDVAGFAAMQAAGPRGMRQPTHPGQYIMRQPQQPGAQPSTGGAAANSAYVSRPITGSQPTVGGPQRVGK